MEDKERLAARLRRRVRALSAAALALICALALYEPRRAETGPADGGTVVAVSRTVSGQTAEPMAPGKTRRDGVYTLLLAGLDDGNGNTDTVMLVRLDAAERRLDAVSIPRDTLLDTNWNVRKLNAAYSMGVYNGESGGETLCRHVANLTGFEPDGYAIVRLRVCEQAIDALGGIDFEVPMAMDYEDEEQGLRIHLRAGLQHLSGAQALGLCRYRSGYPSADLGRIGMQQRFLRACAEQFLTLGNIPNLGRVVTLLAENLETDLNAGSIGWFMRQLLRCPAENLHFATAPCESMLIYGGSYTVLELEPWLALVNESLNPYEQPIRPEELSLVYLKDGALGRTRADSAVAAAPPPTAPAEKEDKPTIIVVSGK